MSSEKAKSPTTIKIVALHCIKGAAGPKVYTQPGETIDCPEGIALELLSQNAAIRADDPAVQYLVFEPAGALKFAVPAPDEPAALTAARKLLDQRSGKAAPENRARTV